jgi:hypothetical protein
MTPPRRTALQIIRDYDEERAAMAAVFGDDKRFEKLRPEQKDLVFREMLAVRNTMVMYEWMIANCDARVRKRGPMALTRALGLILRLRDSSLMTAVQRQIASDSLWKTRPCFEMLEEMRDACGRLDDDTPDLYDPSASALEAQAQREEAERLRAVLIKVGIRSKALVGKMVEFTSGKAITDEAIKKRLANKKGKR